MSACHVYYWHKADAMPVEIGSRLWCLGGLDHYFGF